MLSKKHKLNLDDKLNRNVFNSLRLEGQNLRIFFRYRETKTTDPLLCGVKGLRAVVVISKKLVAKAAWRNQIRRAIYNQISSCCLHQNNVDLIIQLKEKINKKPVQQQIAHIKQEVTDLLIKIKAQN